MRLTAFKHARALASAIVALALALAMPPVLQAQVDAGKAYADAPALAAAGRGISVQAAPKLDRAKAAMRPGQTLTLRLTGAKSAKWSSSRESVATVTAKGKVKAKKAGKSTITAKVGSKTLRCKVTVKRAAKGKVLVAWFSHTGTSEAIAKRIAKQANADLYRIETADAYAPDYEDAERARDEWQQNLRPAIKNPPKSMKGYSRVILCYPIWWHTAPMAVGTFLESCSFSGKAVYPVVQSAAMDPAHFRASVRFVRSCAKGAAVDDGIYSTSRKKISNYVKAVALA